MIVMIVEMMTQGNKFVSYITNVGKYIQQTSRWN